jgi:ApaG protein
METAITEGVQITVRSQFRPESSAVLSNLYFYSYHISIENHNNFQVQLIAREWYIFDSLNEHQFVQGAGVVGEQPILHPNQRYEYTSGCELVSEIGLMKGNYMFKNLETGNWFKVNIPVFQLEFPPKCN